MSEKGIGSSISIRRVENGYAIWKTEWGMHNSEPMCRVYNYFSDMVDWMEDYFDAGQKS